MKLECEIEASSEYKCRVHANITEPCTEVTEIECHHPQGKIDKDVESIAFIGLPSYLVYFIPRGLGGFFPNMTRLSIFSSGLKSICREDLKQFRNLERLNLSYNNLTTLPDDLFQDTPKLTYISFYKNKIESVGSDLFDPIINNKFTWIDFRGNTKIDSTYPSKGVTTVAALLAIIESQCLKPEPPASSDPSQIHHQNFPKGFEDLFDSGKFSDFVIVVNDSKQFRVHKQILAAQCEGFAELFEEEPETTEMEIKDLSPVAIKKFLRFFYTGKVKNFVENSLEIFALAAKLKMPILTQQLEKTIIGQLNESNALKIFSLAHSSGSGDLKLVAFKEIQKMCKYQELPDELIDNLEIVKEIVAAREKYREMIEKMKNLAQLEK